MLGNVWYGCRVLTFWKASHIKYHFYYCDNWMQSVGLAVTPEGTCAQHHRAGARDVHHPMPCPVHFLPHSAHVTAWPRRPSTRLCLYFIFCFDLETNLQKHEDEVILSPCSPLSLVSVLLQSDRWRFPKHLYFLLINIGGILWLMWVAWSPLFPGL